MYKSPSISVVMSVYNVEKYITEAIDSILNQTFNDFEFIIIDDASTDNTLSLIQKYNDPRIVIIKNESNMKLAASLNKGLKIAQGKYIARMDGDDISHLERLEKLHAFLEKNPDVDICGTPMQLFGSESAVWGTLTEDAAIKAGLIWGSTMQHGTVLMRTSTIKKYKLYYDETFLVGQDWKYWYDARNHVKFANLKEPMYFYRRGAQNITVQFSHQSKDRYAIMHRKMISDLGIDFNERDILLHQFIMGLFTLSPSPETIKEARGWLNRLIQHNLKVRAYEPAVFERMAEENWHVLFFKLVPFGRKMILTYFQVSKFKCIHILYYTKYTLNNFLGKNQDENEKRTI